MINIQVRSLINQRFGMLSSKQRIDYLWAFGQARVKNMSVGHKNLNSTQHISYHIMPKNI